MLRRVSWITGTLALGLLTACSGDGENTTGSSSGGTSPGTGGETAGTGGASTGSGGATGATGGAGATSGGASGGTTNTGGGASSGTGGAGTETGGTGASTGGTTSGSGADGPVTLPQVPVSTGCDALPNLASRTVHEVDSDEQSDFAAALAAASAGDVILLKQDVPDTYLKIDGYDFDPQNPVWVIGEAGVNLHALTIQYSSGINVAGFNFSSEDGYTLLKIVASQDIKVLRNSFDLSAVSGHGQSAIITSAYDEPTIENSESIEIGCNSFANIDFDPAYSGSFIKVQYDNGLIPTDLQIHHNHFKNIAPVPQDSGFVGDTDREAIVFGDSDSQDVEANYVVEFNLFEDCDGENEIITVKTSNNTIRYNTFKNSLGSVSVRFGAETHVYGNYFFADGSNQNAYANDTGGIRLYGSKHIVFNNYFEGLAGTGYRMPILLDSGDVSDSSSGNGHERSTQIHVLNNTLVNCTAGLGVGSDNYSLEPNSNTIANNLIVGTDSAALVISAPINTLYDHNMGYDAAPGGTFSETQFTTASTDPLNDDGTVYRLTAGSPAQDAGSTNYSAVVKDDIEGQTRSAPDIGADEYSTSTTSRAPLLPGDVGPNTP